MLLFYIAALEHNGNSITNAFETMINPCHCADFVWMHWKQDFAVVLLYWLQAVTLNADLMSVTVSDNSIQNGLHGIKGFLNHIKGACNAILFQLEVLDIVMMLSFPWCVWMLSLTYYKISPLNKWLITKDVLFLHEPWQNSKEIWKVADMESLLLTIYSVHRTV